MTTFRQISGQLVKSYTTNPDNPLEGQMWYNQTELKLKGLTALEAWSAGSNMISIRGYGAGCGIQTSGLSFGGVEPPGATDTDKTEEYNGSGWSTGGNMVTARRLLGGATAAPQTAALGFGGLTYAGGVQSLTEEYDGSSWTAGGALSTARRTVGGAGIQTAALAFGGYTTVDVTSTEEYDGSAWTAGGSLNTARRMGAGTGLQTAALAFGGDTGSVSTATEKYDGSTWTTSGALNTARRNFGGAGTQTAGLGFGGYTATAVTGATESFDGSTWTTSPASLATARVASTGFGTGTSALSAGGYTTVYLGNTEEYNKSATVYTPAAWSSGATQPVARQDVASFGTSRSEGIMFAGGLISPGYSTSALTYDGTWTSNPSLNTGRGLTQGFGTIAAGNVAGGYDGGEVSATENWNGSTWTTTGSLNNARRNSTAFGTQTAGVVAGSSPAAPPAQGVEHFNGSTWTTATSLPAPTTATYSRGCGTQTAGLWIREASAFEYNGSAWTASNSLNTPRIAGSMGGIQTSALYGTGSQNASTEFYDGTSWRTDANVGIPATRTTSGPAGDASSLVRASGENPASGNYLTSVEDYNPEGVETQTITTT